MAELSDIPSPLPCSMNEKQVIGSIQSQGERIEVLQKKHGTGVMGAIVVCLPRMVEQTNFHLFGTVPGEMANQVFKTFDSKC